MKVLRKLETNSNSWEINGGADLKKKKILCIIMGLKSNVERCHLLVVLHVLKINFENHEQWITLLTPLLSVLYIGLLKSVNCYLKNEIGQESAE